MVSIIIPTYNREHTIKRAVDSVLEQTYQDFELIIVDDASTDNTCQIISEYKDSRIKYLKTEDRHGANHARNVGISNAQGEYIAFQDSDDVWQPDKLEKQMKILQEESDVDIVFSRYLHHLANGKAALVPNKNYSAALLQNDLESILADNNVIGTPTLVIRKTCFDKMGMFDEMLPRFQDWEIVIRFVQEYKIKFLDEALLDAYEMKESISNTGKSFVSGKALIIKKHKDFFAFHGTLKKHIGNITGAAVNTQQLEDILGMWGEDLFLQGLYANAEKNSNMKKNYNLVKDWIRNQNNDGGNINSFFEKFHINSVAVYGMGDIGKLLIEILSDENREKIRYIIDKRMGIASEYEIRTLEQLKRQDYEQLDCIIVTAIAHEEEIQQYLKEVTDIPIVSLYNVIMGK